MVKTCKLVLNIGFVLDLEWTFYIPSFSRNLVSILRFVSFEYFFTFYGITFSMFYKFVVQRNGTLSNDLFWIYLQNNISFNLIHVQNNVIIKRSVMNEKSFMFWHKRSRHTSKGVLKC